MKQLTVLSGKGGTGKTTVVGALSTLAEKKVMADCDVDAADLFLILEPTTIDQGDFFGGRKPILDEAKCTACGICTELCRFEAIVDGTIDPVECEGCGLCALGCPEEAIAMRDAHSGEWFISETRNGPMVHARLGIGEENSGKLVAEVRKLAGALADKRNLKLIIIDGPPGIGCPVISSLAGADMTLIVTEPTVTGLHDLQRLVELSRGFKIPAVVCINKYDINTDKSLQIEEYCQCENLPVVGKVPFDVAVVMAMVENKTIMEYPCPTIHQAMRNMWKDVQKSLQKNNKDTRDAGEEAGS